MHNSERALVTGGAGMLGLDLVRQLLKRGTEVRVLDLEELSERNVESIVGDVRDRAAVDAACEAVDVVYHAAAAVWNPTLPRDIYEPVNLEGTRNVIDACRRKGIGRMLFTSSMDVVVDGRVPIVDGDESLPYPDPLPKDPYSRSKILAEQLVVSANGPGLATCVLRPTGMYGARDKYHLPNLLAAARSSFNVRLGDGSARFSHVYSENVAHAHILAAENLFPGSPVAGEIYFVTDHKPDLNLFEFMEPFLEALGCEPPKLRLPYRLAYLLATLSELFAPRSPFNRFSVIQTCIDHTFVSDKARRDFGYEPVVSPEEAFRRTLTWARRRFGAETDTRDADRSAELEERV